MKVLAGGRFNIIHPGHIHFLKKARSLGDELVVVIARDETVKRNKARLLFPDKERKLMVEAIRFVDKVVIGYSIKDSSGYLKILKDEKPDIIALGYDQPIDPTWLRMQVAREGIPCRIVRIGKFKNYQTKKIIKEKS